MPWKSDAQRRWGHTEKGEKSLGGASAVEEWDEATKGKKLPKKMAFGGDPGDDQMNTLYNFLQPSGAGTIAPSAEPVPEQNDMVNKFLSMQAPPTLQSPSVKTDAMPANVSPVKPGAFTPEPGSKTRSSFPGTAPDDLSDYFKTQGQQADKYGPEQEMTLMQNLLKGENGLGSNIAKAGAGLADAIESGVARAANPGFLNNLQEQEKQTNETVGALIPTAQKMSEAQIEERQKLAEANPKSPVNQAMMPGLKAGFKAAFPQMSTAQIDTIASNPAVAEKIMPLLAEVQKAQAELAYEQGTREDAKVGQIAGRYNKPINDAQKSIDDLDASIKGLQSGDLGQIASAQAIVSQALKLSPRLAKEAGGQSYAAKLDQWASGKFGNESVPTELMTPVLNVLNRQKQTYVQQRNNYIQQAGQEGGAMRVDPNKIKAMFGNPQQPTTLGAGGNYSPDVIAYAQKYGVSPQKAQSIKDKRGNQ